MDRSENNFKEISRNIILKSDLDFYLNLYDLLI